MSRRKNGETHKQYIRRLEAKLSNSEANNTALRQHLFNLSLETEKANPRTNRSYITEAQELFNTVALVEMFIRCGEAENAVAMLYSQLQEFGYNQVEVLQNEALQDGSYNTLNKVPK